MSGGLFIFASTVLKYILDPEDVEDCRDRLRKVTSVVAKGIAATNTVDKVYELIITEASRSEAVDSDELQRMRCILACILTARISLSVEALSALIDIRPARLRSSLRRLHSIVHVPSDDSNHAFRPYMPRSVTICSSVGRILFELRLPWFTTSWHAAASEDWGGMTFVSTYHGVDPRFSPTPTSNPTGSHSPSSTHAYTGPTMLMPPQSPLTLARRLPRALDPNSYSG